MDNKKITSARHELYNLLNRRNNNVHVKNIDEFSAWDKAIFYAIDSKREMIVTFSHMISTTSLSHYSEKADEFHDLATFFLEVPHEIGRHTHEIIDIFDAWFANK